MVMQVVTVNNTYWDTQTSSIWSYTVPKTVRIGNKQYKISFYNNKGSKGK